MIAGIVGLGLIGASFAKAYKTAGHTVLGWNRSRSALDYLKLAGDVDDELTMDRLRECDIVIISVYPDACIEYLEKAAPYFGKKPVVIDCCGTKRKVTEVGFKLADEYGFTFVGGHPMAGTHNSGYKYAKADMYKGAPMVLVPNGEPSIKLLSHTKELLAPAGFGSISVTTAEKHDEMIAFTSQLAHVVSNAYIKSPTAREHKGFSAGSYKDMTRVAWLNPEMWAELFLENGDNLIKELDILVENLDQYRTAIRENNKEELVKLLDDGRKIKAEVDGR